MELGSPGAGGEASSNCFPCTHPAAWGRGASLSAVALPFHLLPWLRGSDSPELPALGAFFQLFLLLRAFFFQAKVMPVAQENLILKPPSWVAPHLHSSLPGAICTWLLPAQPAALRPGAVFPRAGAALAKQAPKPVNPIACPSAQGKGKGERVRDEPRNQHQSQLGGFCRAPLVTIPPDQVECKEPWGWDKPPQT